MSISPQRSTTIDCTELATRIEQGHELNAEEALELLSVDDAEVFRLVAAAGILRRKHFGNTVKVNYLVNLKSGLCPEDCTYCSQRLGSKAEILKYTWLKPEEAVHQAGLGIAGGASRVCMVASGKGPTDRDIDRVAAMIGSLKEEHPQVEVCACIGILKEGQAQRLKAAGADAYNHNLNTAESLYPDICSTHSYAERVSTVEQSKSAGLSPCSGLIVGLGETAEQLVEAIFALRALDADSIPVNFLMPFDGTPLQGTWNLTPLACLRILAVVRMACPDKEIRMAGGREMHLRSLQANALEVANSLFLGDYLTSEGQDAKTDLAMIADAGFVVLGQEDQDPASIARALGEAAAHAARQPEDAGNAGANGCSGSCCSSDASPACGSGSSGCGPAASQPLLRRRGAGTRETPNA
ncbi:MAG TPA: biotin synthase BioB [Glutamicibacter sp.]|uniref:Biotin synthase n=1 Tax=Glutamicibacter arilaitensis (strain DSM 16368 / CIP 108037 / IAM 15318 / JCM 13566 / NCIMB 14258 / Re117) TaxID=861360 RepID=A0ABP1U197_GLUAR|nr:MULTISPECIES: biotin synthase BioB [Glutamicibacter]CBT75169.1 biotin synthase [Glutamicibacter arilaitensis Re117]HCH48662.1 biotin synthase BioB [Glutamicibacter sp.]